MRKGVLVGLVTLGLAVGLSTRAWASTIVFDPAGNNANTTTDKTIDNFDPAQGNSLSLGLSAGSTAGSTGTLLFQANLGQAKLLNVSQFDNGDSVGGVNRFFTFAAAFQESILSNSGGAFPTLIFGPPIGGGPTNGVFNMYSQAAVGDDLAGTCFVNCGANPAILTGTFLNNAFFFGNFTANLAATGNLDQFGADNYPAIDSIAGTGGFQAQILITAVNNNFFPGLVPGTVLFITTTQQNLPFSTVNPSFCFSTNAVTSCNQAGAQIASIGALNGVSGPNTMLQTDANVSFQEVAQVPEPATLSLLGLGLLAGSRKLRKAIKKS